MSMTARELALKVGGHVEGDAERVIKQCAAREDAGPGAVALAQSPAEAGDDRAVWVVAPGTAQGIKGKTLVVVDDPAWAFREALVVLHGFRSHPAPGIDEHAFVDPTAVVGELCTLRPFVYISPRTQLGKRSIVYPHCYVGKEATIGDDVVLYSNVTVYDRCEIGNRVQLHAGAVVGSDAGDCVVRQGRSLRLPVTGRVVIEDDVEIGANAVIVRPVVGCTVIVAGTRVKEGMVVPAGSRLEG